MVLVCVCVCVYVEGGIYIKICVNSVLVHILCTLQESQIELVVPVDYVFIWNSVVIHVL